jgi:hypothetical protein
VEGIRWSINIEIKCHRPSTVGRPVRSHPTGTLFREIKDEDIGMLADPSWVRMDVSKYLGWRVHVSYVSILSKKLLKRRMTPGLCIEKFEPVKIASLYILTIWSFHIEPNIHSCIKKFEPVKMASLYILTIWASHIEPNIHSFALSLA